MTPDNTTRLFHPREWLECKYLAPWLEVATRRLSDESKDRVREEIRAHFHDAVDTGVSRGLVAESAAEEALAGLGPPRAAGRAFRRSYLTSWQDGVRLYRQLPGALTVCFALMVMLQAWVAIRAFQRGQPEWLVRSILVAGMAAALILLAGIAPRLHRIGRERAAVCAGLVGYFALYGLWISSTKTGAYAPYFTALMVVLFLLQAPVLLKVPSRRPTD